MGCLALFKTIYEMFLDVVISVDKTVRVGVGCFYRMKKF